MSRPRKLKVGVIREARTEFGHAFEGQRGKGIFSLAATVLAAALDLAKPWPAAFVIDSILSRELSQRTSILGIVAAGLVLIWLSVAAANLSYAANLRAAEVGRVVTVRVRRQLFEHLNRLALPFHSSARVGDLLVRLTGDVTLVRDLLFTSWLGLVELGLQLVGLAVVMFLVDWQVGLVLLAPVIALFLKGRKSNADLRTAVRKQRRSQGESAAIAAESLSQIHVVKAYGAEEQAVGRFASNADNEERQGLRAASIAAAIERRAETSGAIGSGLVLVVGALRVLSGSMTVGELIVLVSYAKSFFKPLRKISSELTRVAKASAVTERLLEVLRVQPEDHHMGIEAPRFRGEIQFENVTFGYVEGRQVLSGASIRIAPGQLVALMGGNGQGKSTFLSLILRLLEPSTGRVLIDDLPVSTYQLDSYRSRLAYVPQDLRLFSGSVADNIRFGKTDASDDDIRAAAELASFSQVVEGLADGYESELGEGGSTLSAGEARRLMLARAAVRDADILLLDEPFAGLDSEAMPAVGRSIRDIARGRTTIVVTHDGLANLQPDVVIELDDGLLVSPGTDVLVGEAP
jgi:ATP-binding cassette subfamily B protein